MNKFIKAFAFFAIVFLVFGTSGCNEVECSFAEDQQIIKDYLSNNGLTAIERETGLHFLTQEEGIGSLYPTFSSLVTVKYKGYFTDGTIFDQNDKGIEFPLSGVIPGWQEGLTLMKKQSKAQMFLPSSLAYGVQPVGGMEGRECSVLIFDVELIDFK